MNQQAIAGILLLDETSLETLRTAPEALAGPLGLMPIDIEALRKADRLAPKFSNTQTVGTITITASPEPTTITMNTMTITAHPGESEGDEQDDEGNPVS